MKRLLSMAALAVALAAPAHAQIFDNQAGQNGSTNRSDDNGLGQGFSLSANETVSSFGFYTDFFSAGVYKLFIAEASDNVIFSTTFTAAVNGSGLLSSGPMLFFLLAGNNYSFGLIGGPGTNYLVQFHFPEQLTSQNGMTPLSGNENWANFATPTRFGDGGATIAMRIDGTSGAVATAPEPSTVALMATGLAGVLGVVRRRRRTTA